MPMPDEEEYKYLEIDPANIPKDGEISFETGKTLFEKLNEKTGIPILDQSRAITKLYELVSRTPSPAPIPPPPVPKKDASSPLPTEPLPTLPAVEDSPQQQGAGDVEAKIIIEVRPSEAEVSRPRAI